MKILHKQSTLHCFMRIAATVCSFSTRSTITEGLFEKLHLRASLTSPFLFGSRPIAKGHFGMSSSSAADAEPYDDVRNEKQAVRKKLRSAMKNLTAEDIEAQSNSVWKNVFELPVYQSANSVGLFLSMPTGEINTDLILQHCVREGKDIYVPEVGKNFELCDMELRKVVLDPNVDAETNGMFHKAWPTNKWKIPEPPADMPTVTAKPGDIDLMIVPGLGFDRKRNRLGQGKGYYDRFIAKMTKDGQKLPLVAVALSPQLLENIQIPVAPYDQQMDMVVLPREVITSSD
mmetsp:Transcript_24929/g.54796  ORF Transcript_24929/g.54796 Transcript_24929/m.54796 type:complete len:288 (+) Transcript_24929:16-879(+)